MTDYEAFPDGILAFTAARSVRWVFRKGIKTRVCGENRHPAPGQQCLGEMEWECALFPLAAGTEARELPVLADSFLHPPLAWEAGVGPYDTASAAPPSGEAGSPGLGAWMDVTPAWIPCSALKPAEDGDGTVVRFWNPAGEAVEIRIRFGLPFGEAWRARMDETREERLRPETDGTFVLPVAARGVVTVRLGTL